MFYPQNIQQVVTPTTQLPKIFTLEVIDRVEDLSYRSAPTNGNPAFYMLSNDNKIYQMRWNGRSNEITAFNVFPCVEYQQPQQQQSPQVSQEDRLTKIENQLASLINALGGGNNEPSTNGNNSTSSAGK